MFVRATVIELGGTEVGRGGGVLLGFPPDESSEGGPVTEFLRIGVGEGKGEGLLPGVEGRRVGGRVGLGGGVLRRTPWEVGGEIVGGEE